MPLYVDGFLLPISKKKVAAYRRVSAKAGKIFRDLGALEYRECAGNDLKATKGMGVAFPRRVQAKPGETVIFSWIVYKSKAHRDQVNKKMMKDPRMAKLMTDPKAVPFDVKRMAYGGFEVIVDL